MAYTAAASMSPQPSGFSQGRTYREALFCVHGWRPESALHGPDLDINPFYGNAFLGFHPDELFAIGIKQGQTLTLEVHEKQWPVFYGNSYGDVPLGEWVMFLSADENLLLVRKHESATENMGPNRCDPNHILRSQDQDTDRPPSTFSTA